MHKLFIPFLLLLHFSCFGQGELRLKTAKGHPMMYFLSLPENWTASKRWPVVVVLESAAKEFKKNAERFVEARGNAPFILVAPLNTNNGNQGRKDPTVFPYSKETWDYIDRVGDCQFNSEGIRQIMIDVQNEFKGESKVFITGFEAGAHDLWSIVFNHPEYLKAAAPVAGNYRGRCISLDKISNDVSKNTLPIMSFVGEKDEGFGRSAPIYIQWLDVKKLAISNGFQNISETIVPNAGHVPMPKEVLNYFGSFLK